MFFLVAPWVARLLVCAGVATLTACSPTFNWRDVRPDNTRLAVLLPCKPNPAEKKVMLGERAVVLRLLGCTAGDASFAVTVAEVGDTSGPAGVMAQWQSAMLTHIKAQPIGALSAKTQEKTDKDATEVLPFKLPGAAGHIPAVLLKARGQRPDGTAVSGQAAYFVQGTQVFQAVVYAADIPPEVAETFFSGLKFE